MDQLYEALRPMMDGCVASVIQLHKIAMRDINSGKSTKNVSLASNLIIDTMSKVNAILREENSARKGKR